LPGNFEIEVPQTRPVSIDDGGLALRREKKPTVTRMRTASTKIVNLRNPRPDTLTVRIKATFLDQNDKSDFIAY
jgi:hypothetical protein